MNRVLRGGKYMSLQCIGNLHEDNDNTRNDYS